MVFRVFLAALLACGLATAQRQKGAGNNTMGDSRDMPSRASRTTRFDTIADKLRLSKEQKDQAATIFDAAQQTAAPLNEQILNGRKQITGAYMQNQASGEGFEKLMAAYTEVLAQMAGLEADAYGKLYAILKPNQQKGAPQVFAEQFPGLFASRDWKRVR